MSIEGHSKGTRKGKGEGKGCQVMQIGVEGLGFDSFSCQLQDSFEFLGLGV